MIMRGAARMMVMIMGEMARMMVMREMARMRLKVITIVMMTSVDKNYC